MPYLTDFIKKFNPPSLPTSPVTYEQQYQDKYNSILRLFFNEVINAIQSVFGLGGGRFLNVPFGEFNDLTDQTAASVTVAYPVALGNTNFANFVSVQNGSEVLVEYNGIYEIIVSLQLANDDTQLQTIDFWFSKNGVTIPDTRNVFSVPERHGGQPGRLVAMVAIMAKLEAGDFVQVMWHTTNLAAYIEHIPADVSPTRPASPSAILSVKHVSNSL